MQTKSKNHETCRGVMLSHVEAVVKNCEGLEQVVMSDAKNPDISTCHHIGSRLGTLVRCAARRSRMGRDHLPNEARARPYQD